MTQATLIGAPAAVAWKPADMLAGAAMSIPLWEPILPSHQPAIADQTAAPSIDSFPNSARVARRIIRSYAGEFWLGGHQLLRPIRASLVVTVREVVAVESVTGIFGVGVDPGSAIQDLRSALQEHFEVLSRERALSEDLTDQLAFLRDHLRLV